MAQKAQRAAGGASVLHVQLPSSIASLAPSELRTFVATAVAEARLHHVSNHLVQAGLKDSDDSDAQQQQNLRPLDPEVRLSLFRAVYALSALFRAVYTLSAHSSVCS